jgi:hypothetical protein
MTTAGLFGRGIAAGVVAVALLGAPVASAQEYSADPYFDWTLVQSQAAGFEKMSQILLIIESVDRSQYEQLSEHVKMLTGGDLDRFIGSLAAADAELADELRNMLGAIANGVNRSENVTRLLPIARQLLAEAWNTVIPAEISDQPAFTAAVMAQLLLGEDGATEGLERAFVQPWEFAYGWSATQRVKELWVDMSSLASPDIAANIDTGLAALDDIFTSPVPPADFEGIIPDEAEDPALSVVTNLEIVADAQLFAGRDPLVLVNHLVDLAGPACQSYEAGDEAIGREMMYAILDNYGDTTGLRNTLSLLAPDVNEQALNALSGLVIIDDYVRAGGPVTLTGDAATAACNALAEALGEARSVFGG